MDPTTTQKKKISVWAMKSPNSSKIKRSSRNFWFLYNLILQLLISMACAFILSNSFWFPLAKQCLLLITHPIETSYSLGPGCLFVVANVIIIILVWDAAIKGSREPSPGYGIYDEYVRRCNVIGKHPVINTSTLKKAPKEEKSRVIQVEEEKNNETVTEEETMPMDKDAEVNQVEEDKNNATAMEDETMPMDKDVEAKNQSFTSETESRVNIDRPAEVDTSIAPCQCPTKEKEEEDELPCEELNRRAEAFIARVNRQRYLEARSLMNFPTQRASRSIAICG